jgi:hypothetical protein
MGSAFQAERPRPDKVYGVTLMPEEREGHGAHPCRGTADMRRLKRTQVLLNRTGVRSGLPNVCVIE